MDTRSFEVVSQRLKCNYDYETIEASPIAQTDGANNMKNLPAIPMANSRSRVRTVFSVLFCSIAAASVSPPTAGSVLNAAENPREAIGEVKETTDRRASVTVIAWIAMSASPRDSEKRGFRVFSRVGLRIGHSVGPSIGQKLLGGGPQGDNEFPLPLSTI